MAASHAAISPANRDEPLYLPIIARVRASLQQTGLLYVDDSKLGGLQNRAALHAAGDAYLCPLGQVQLPAAARDTLIEQALARGPLVPISRPDADGQVVRTATGQPVIHAEAWETRSDLTATVDAQPVTWTDRRIVVRAPALQAQQQQALERRLAAAEADLADLLTASHAAFGAAAAVHSAFCIHPAYGVPAGAQTGLVCCAPARARSPSATRFAACRR